MKNLALIIFLICHGLVSVQATEAPKDEKKIIIPVIQPPTGFTDEGTETQLSKEQLAVIQDFLSRSDIDIRRLLERVKTYPISEAVDELQKGFAAIVNSSDKKETEILVRFILNRANKISNVIRKEYAPLSARMRSQSRLKEFDLLLVSGKLALEYFRSLQQSYTEATAKNIEKSIQPAYAKFGVDYAQHLMVTAENLLDASAQYNVVMLTLGLLQWDLYRDQHREAFGPAIREIYDYVSVRPETAPANLSDAELIQELRLARATFNNAIKWYKVIVASAPARSRE